MTIKDAKGEAEFSRMFAEHSRTRCAGHRHAQPMGFEQVYNLRDGLTSAWPTVSRWSRTDKNPAF